MTNFNSGKYPPRNPLTTPRPRNVSGPPKRPPAPRKPPAKPRGRG